MRTVQNNPIPIYIPYYSLGTDIMKLIIGVFSMFEIVTLLAKSNDDSYDATKVFRKIKMIKQLEEDFQRYPNMSLVLLDKCGKLAPEKIAPCTLSVLDNDQALLIGILKSNPFTLVNLLNKHLASFPNIPLRKMKDGVQCKKPDIVHDKLLETMYPK